jgi:hypothetical protein
MGHRPLPFRWKKEQPVNCPLGQPSFSGLAAITRDFEKNIFALQQALVDFQRFHYRWRLLAENLGEEQLMAAMDLLLAEFSVASERNKRCLDDAKRHLENPVVQDKPKAVVAIIELAEVLKNSPAEPVPMSWRERLDSQL